MTSIRFHLKAAWGVLCAKEWDMSKDLLNHTPNRLALQRPEYRRRVCPECLAAWDQMESDLWEANLDDGEAA